MITKYSVINPTNGENVLYDTKEEALAAFWDLVMYMVNMHFHNTPYVLVDIDDNGVETWRNVDGEEVIRPLTPEEMEEKINLLRAQRRLTTPTQVEVLP